MVDSLAVDTFGDVDLTTLGPVGADRPPGGPDAAAVRHGEGVEDEEAAVVGAFGVNPDGVAILTGLELGRVVDFKERGVVCLDVSEAFAKGILLALEVDQAVSGIGASEKLPIVKEILPLVSVG